MMGQFLVLGGTSAIHPEDESTFQLYPNPTTGQLMITPSNKDQDQVIITDHLGRIMLTKPMSEIKGTTLQIDLSHLPSGTYWMQTSNSYGQINEAHSFQIIHN